MSGGSCFAFRRVFAELFTSNIFMPADYFVSSLSWFASDMDDERRKISALYALCASEPVRDTSVVEEDGRWIILPCNLRGR